MPKPIIGSVWVIDPNGGNAHTVDDVWEVVQDGEAYGDTFTLYHNDGSAGSQSLWSEVKGGFGTLTEAIDYADAHPNAGTVKMRFNQSELVWLASLLEQASDPSAGILDTVSGGRLQRDDAREVFAFLATLQAKIAKEAV